MAAQVTKEELLYSSGRKGGSVQYTSIHNKASYKLLVEGQ